MVFVDFFVLLLLQLRVVYELLLHVVDVLFLLLVDVVLQPFLYEMVCTSLTQF